MILGRRVDDIGSGTRRKSRWKLKFHHQALPPEYLDHYEASLQCKNPPSATTRTATGTTFRPVINNKINNNNKNSLKVRSNSPSVSCNRNDTLLPLKPSPVSNSNNLQSTVRYKDLPFMGEMTLDNARPRRGRKPKKADICHLIYKNYGTTVLDEPLNLCVRDLMKNGNHIPRKTKAAQIPEKRCALQQQLVSSAAARCGDKQRKNRKSLARERLEQTFKEKGFLIQTQQLQSAQGATYCKFRQLRKFTRYLFRSWKHYLPGDIANNNNASS